MDVLVIYGWGGNFCCEERPYILTDIIDNLESEPNKLSVSVRPKGKEYRATLSKNKPADVAIGKYKDIERISLDRISDGNFLNTEFHLSIREGNTRRYVVGINRNWEDWSISHIRFLARFISPKYGFIVSGSVPDALFYVSGVATSAMSREWKMGADSLMREVIHHHRYLDGFIHDVYALNIISCAHMNRVVDGKRISSWLDSGEWGQVLTAGMDAYIWLVPPDMRNFIMDKLKSAGILLT